MVLLRLGVDPELRTASPSHRPGGSRGHRLQAKRRSRGRRHLPFALGEVRHGFDGAHLGLVLDRLAVRADVVDRGEGRGVQVRLDELALLVAAELVDGHARGVGELLELLLHGLAELAPGRVNLS